MKLNRRQFMIAGASGITAAALPGMPAFAAADSSALKQVNAFTGGKKPVEDMIDLTTPEIAENGNNVPIEVSVDSEMSGNDLVEEVIVFADGNPQPEVVKFSFTPLSGEATAKTRVRLAQTQNVIAVAKMTDGSFRMAQNQVKVTIGGCGG